MLYCLKQYSIPAFCLIGRIVYSLGQGKTFYKSANVHLICTVQEILVETNGTVSKKLVIGFPC